MDMNRRSFLKGTAWMGAAAFAGGCLTDGLRICGTGGCYCRFGWRESLKDPLHKFFDEKKAAEMRLKYRHPLWKQSGELSERSVRSGSKPQDVPDFTGGGWKTAKPLAIEGVDMAKMDFDRGKLEQSKGQMNI